MYWNLDIKYLAVKNPHLSFRKKNKIVQFNLTKRK